MKKTLSFVRLFFQISVTFILLVGIFMILALLESDFGFDGLVGLLFSLIYAIVFAVITIIICLAVGLPLRLNLAAKAFWKRNYMISPIGIVIGFMLIYLSYVRRFANITTTEAVNPDDNWETLTPNLLFISVGWFLIAFMALHFFPPKVTKIATPPLDNIKV